MEWLRILLDIATYSTFFVCLFIKLPQIILLTKAKSSEGLSLKGLLLEETGYIVFATYHLHHHYPVSMYVEYPILIVQDTILLILIVSYDGHWRRSIIYTLLFVGGWKLLTIQEWVIDIAMSLCTLISASGKFAQIQCLWKTQDSSQVSALSWGMSTYTCMARTFTTFMTTDDMRVLLRICVLTTLNAWVLSTILYYRRGSKKQE